MAQFKSFEPKEGYEGLALEINTQRVEKTDDQGNIVLDSSGNPVFDRPEGSPLSIGSSAWPFTARSDQEQKHLENHPWLQEAQGDIDATPAAITLANAEGVDLHDVTGSGEGGRVLKEDVEKVISEREAG